MLPQIRRWLEQLSGARLELDKNERRLAGLMASGQDMGGELVNKLVRLLAEIKGLIQGFQSREIILKDLERGLVDFPALIGGREVFLCWEKGEDDIEFWHEIDSGYAGREPL
jgi:hypothetical protein